MTKTKKQKRDEIVNKNGDRKGTDLEFGPNPKNQYTFHENINKDELYLEASNKLR